MFRVVTSLLCDICSISISDSDGFTFLAKYLALLFGLVFTEKSRPELELRAASAVVSHGCDHLGCDFRIRLSNRRRALDLSTTRRTRHIHDELGRQR